MTELILVHTTAGSREDAERIAERLVTSKLAACCQVSGPIRSYYRWEGQLQQSEEWVCVAKTRRGLFDSVESSIREGHSYEEPEIFATSLELASKGYHAWALENLEGHES